MTPDRLKRIEKLFRAACEKNADERSAFLADACGDDRSLREEVESLLVHDERPHRIVRDEALARAGGKPVAFLSDFDDTLSREASSSVAVNPRIDIEGYEIIRELGRGGQGTVYLARQMQDGRTVREVALKILNERASSDPNHVERLVHEASVLADLDHPNLVKLWDQGDWNGRPYYAMQYVEGSSLAVHIEENRLSTTRRLRLIREVCEAVNYLHQQAIIHRDLKPGNIRVSTTGHPYLIDLGLAKQAGVFVEPFGSAAGTLSYMAPEQTLGDPRQVDTRTDVYALGVLLYQMLTGAHPIAKPRAPDADSRGETFRRIRDVSPDEKALRQAELDKDVQAIILKCLSKEKEQRYQSVASLLADLDRYARMTPTEARRQPSLAALGMRFTALVARHPVASTVVGLVLIVALGVLWARFEAKPTSPAIITWTDRTFARAAESAARALTPRKWSDSIVIVGFDDETQKRLNELAAKMGCPDVTLDIVKSWRVLHGALMKRLAEASPRVVVWDYYFPDPQERYDAAFIEGMKALQDGGTKVVVAAAKLDADAVTPRMSDAILHHVDGWGLIHARVREKASPEVGIIRRLASNAPLPGLSLTAFHLMQHPDCDVRLDWAENGELTLRYRREGQWESHVDLVPLTHSEHFTTSASKVRLDGRMGYLRLELADQTDLDDHTVRYHEVLEADSETLRERFRDKVIVVGDMRWQKPTPDTSDMGSGYREGKVFNVYFIAEAIAALSDAHSIQRAASWLPISWCTGFAACGLYVGSRLNGHRKRARRIGVMVIIAVGAAGATLIVYVWTRHLWPPASMVLALWLGTVIGSRIASAYASLQLRQVIVQRSR